MKNKGGTKQLQQRISVLKAECDEMEQEISARIDYLQDNFTGMATTGILESILSVPKSLIMKKDFLGNMLKANSIKDFFKKMFVDLVKSIALRFGLNLVREFAENQAEKNAAENEEQTQETSFNQKEEL